jgi:hypothetical protein
MFFPRKFTTHSTNEAISKETLVRSDHPMMILLYILCIMLCVPLFFFLSYVERESGMTAEKLELKI